MATLKNATNGGATIGPGQKSQVFRCVSDKMHIYLGGTAGTATLTLTASFSKTGGFVPYVINNVSGVPTVQEFTAAQLAASTLYHHGYLEHCGNDIYFQFLDNNNDPTSSWQIAVGGEKVEVVGG